MEHLTVISGSGEHFELSLPERSVLLAAAALCRKKLPGEYVRQALIRLCRQYFPDPYQDSLERISGADAIKLASALALLAKESKAGAFSYSFFQDADLAVSCSGVTKEDKTLSFPLSESRIRENQPYFFHSLPEWESFSADGLFLRENCGRENEKAFSFPPAEDSFFSVTFENTFSPLRIAAAEVLPEFTAVSLPQSLAENTFQWKKSMPCREKIPAFKVCGKSEAEDECFTVLNEENGAEKSLAFTLPPAAENASGKRDTDITDEVIWAAYRFKWSLEYASSLPRNLLRRCLEIAGVRHTLPAAEIPEEIYTPEAVKLAAARAAEAVASYRKNS